MARDGGWVFRALRPSGPLDRPHEIEGAAFEGLIGQHLRAWIAYERGDFELSYWRTRAGTEIDFIVNGVRCIPAHEFLAGIRPGRGLAETT